jgi:3-isopropylmalate/(R)-2-methylmalate dehydratase small subunit
MQPFKQHTGRVVPLDRSNIDTDQIIPKQFLKRVERTGFGQFLFHDWRFLEDGSDNPEFALNHPHHQGASVLLSRRNFGSGSSREHAPWALEDHGFRVIVAISFADIFYNNCFKNGILPIALEEEIIEDLFQRVARHRGHELTVDLEACKIRDEHGLELTFEVDPDRQRCLLHGLDDIGMTLEHTEKIAAYESNRGVS